MVCSKQLYKEALNHAFDEPKQWEIREINEIMNQCISGWRYFPNPRMFSEYGRQKGWERENPATDSGNPSEKRWTVLWRSQNRWSFHSENDSPLHPCCYPVAEPVAGENPLTFGLFSLITTKTTEK